jgi:hypothetical protein
MSNLLNDIVLSQDIVDAFFAMDDDVVSACDEKAKQICREFFPKVDISREENIELVVRPMSAVIALNELMLQNIFSMSSIDGVYSSTTIPEKLKVPILKNYAILNGIETVSNDVESLFSEVKFGIRSKSMNLETSVVEKIKESIDIIDRIMFIESDALEMDRNKISYVQINHIDVMNFKRSEYNGGTIIDTAYDRGDYQRYQDYKNSDAIELPGTLDVYFSTELNNETITVQRDADGYFRLDKGYYINISKDSKDFTILEDNTTKWGIVETSPVIYVSDSDVEEDFHIVKYKYADFNGSIKTDDFTIMDILFKGFYPIFVDFTVYSKSADVNTDEILLAISDYLNTISGDISMISYNDMSDKIRASGNNVVLSSANQYECFTNLRMSFGGEAVFPISMKDVNIPVDLRRSSITERTIKMFARSVNVIQE